jgi:hypothetical protein
MSRRLAVGVRSGCAPVQGPAPCAPFHQELLMRRFYSLLTVLGLALALGVGIVGCGGTATTGGGKMADKKMEDKMGDKMSDKKMGDKKMEDKMEDKK